MTLTPAEASSTAAAGIRRYGVARARRSAAVVVPLGLALGDVWLTFQAGGFFAGTTGLAVLATGAALVAWLMLTGRPFAALSAPLALALGALTLFALWTLVSQAWSGAPARAVLESDRALLYVLAVALFGLAAAAPVVRRNMPRAVAAALAVVSVCGLISRLLPDLWPVPASLDFERLSYPITYWNAQGLMGALAVVACLHLVASGREPAAIRAMAAAAVPLAATAVLFTFSRGAILVTPIGVIAYLALGDPRRLASAALATVPTTAVALVVAYRADAVVNAVRPTDALVSQGKTVAAVVAACAIVAAAIVVWLRPLDDRVRGWRRPSRAERRMLVGVAVVAALAGSLALHLPQRIVERADNLGRVESVADTGDTRARLTNLADSGRIEQWRVALDAFARHPVIGSGAGTYALLWARYRRTDQAVTDGHSLYLEVLAEFGVVGFVLIVTAVGSLLAGAARSGRGSDPSLGAVAFALTLMWAVHAGIDWDWEMPALTLPVLAIAAAATAVPDGGSERTPWPGRLPRLVGGIALLVLLVTPFAIVRSQAKLDAAVNGLRAGRCPQAIRAALDSTSALSIRPEPFQVLGLCDARLGRGDLAVAAMQAAVRRDPGSWQLLYGLGVIRASQGLDPRPSLAAARSRDPRSQLIESAIRRFDTDRPALWRRRALTTPLPS